MLPAQWARLSSTRHQYITNKIWCWMAYICLDNSPRNCPFFQKLHLRDVFSNDLISCHVPVGFYPNFAPLHGFVLFWHWLSRARIVLQVTRIHLQWFWWCRFAPLIRWTIKPDCFMQVITSSLLRCPITVDFHILAYFLVYKQLHVPKSVK